MSLSFSRRLSALALTALLGAACTSGRTQNQPTPPPTVSFQTPSEGSFLHGTVTITARAVGEVKIASFKFDAPAALAGTVPALDPTTKSAVLSTQLDLSTFVDGALKVTVTAKDELGGSTTKDLSFTVASRAPSITVESPSAGALIRGAAIAVSARATPQAGATITKLELLDPPTGMGANTAVSASQWAATWNSTTSLEGSVNLHFRATDSTGLVADSFVAVTVDNAPLGRIDAYVSAGAPIADAYVEVWAVSNTTQAVDTTAGANGLLGSGGPTDASGHILVTLTSENYRGPVQLRAVPAQGTTLSYLDPTASTPTSIQIPGSVTLSSLLPDYATGQAVTTPITLTTTLADYAVLAYANGSHRLYPTSHTISDAAAFTDPLIVQHDQATTPRWNLRTTRPAELTGAPITLGDRAYAAFMDVALNQLATDLSSEAGVAGVITAPGLLSKLLADLDADGQLDGQGAGGSQITTGVGSPPYAFDANTFRNRLATALDRWILGPRNTSGLTRSTLYGSSIYDQISNDTSALFGSQPPVAFDNTAPALTVAVTYGPSQVAPHAGTYVSGSTKLVITATDPARVQSVTAMLGNVSLDSAALITRSADRRTLTYTVTVDTRTLADMTYSLSVTTSDEQTNSATTTPATITVDNTPPTVATIQPSATAAYSGNVPFNGTASDGVGSGLATLTTSGFAGLIDGNDSATNFLGTWSIPAGVADGRVNGGWIACDYVGNCSTIASTPIALSVDRTAPAVAFTATPPLASNTASAAFTGTVSDTSGVAAVWLSLNGEPPTRATLSAGTWSYTYPSVRRGPNTVVVWGDDVALPTPNSGNNPGTLSQVNFSFFRDDVAPTASYVATFASYYDERNLIAQATSGQATVPAAYTYASATKATVPASGGHVYRAATRLAWASPPTAAQLEGPNIGNVPTLQFSVPYDSAVDSPITAATATVSYACASCLIPNDTNVALWLSPTPATNAVLYDLPLASNILPGLAATTTTTTVTITVAATDAGGNTGSVQLVTLTFHPLGGALVVSPDAAYASSDDRNSTYPYVIRNVQPDYRDLFSSAITWDQNAVRLQRYIVTNPEPYPVAFSAAGLPASWSMTESWQAGPPGTPTTTTNLCDDTHTNPSDSGPPASTTANTAATAPVRVFARNLQGVVEGTLATPSNSNDIIVPAASGGTPGAVALYIARERVSARTGPTMTWNPSTNRFDGGTGYRVAVFNIRPGCCEPLEAGVCYFPGARYDRRDTPYRYYLLNAQDDAGTTFTITTYGLTGTARSSEGNPFPATIPVPKPLH